MRIGIPQEILTNENRVSLTPAGVKDLVQLGHEVYVQSEAGNGSGYTNEDYLAAGGAILENAAEVWSIAEMVMKVKEPQASEYGYFRQGLILFTYLHLAVEPRLTQALIDSKVTAIAYETVYKDNTLPLLMPMSEVAGRMAAQIGARLLEKQLGGMGILLGGVPGVKRGKVTVIGGGVVGMNAALIASGLGANVVILEQNPDRLRMLSSMFGSRAEVLMSDSGSIAEHVADSDLAIGAVLLPGGKAPTLVSEEVVKSMRAGSVIVDVAIDQGGIFETIDRKTTYADPTYTKFGVVHYAVANMPGAVPRTSTMALTNATLPYARLIAQLGIHEAVTTNAALYGGGNTAGGLVTHPAGAEALGQPCAAVEEGLLTS